MKIKFLHYLNIILFVVSILIPPIGLECPERGVVASVIIYLFVFVLLIDLFYLIYSYFIYSKSSDKKIKKVIKKLKYVSLFYLFLMIVFSGIFFVWSKLEIC